MGARTGPQGMHSISRFTILGVITESIRMVARPMFLLLGQQHNVIEVAKHPSKLIKRGSV